MRDSTSGGKEFEGFPGSAQYQYPYRDTSPAFPPSAPSDPMAPQTPAAWPQQTLGFAPEVSPSKVHVPTYPSNQPISSGAEGGSGVLAPLAQVMRPDGHCGPRRLGWQDMVPVAKSPTGRWADVTRDEDGICGYVVFVLVDDGTYAPYRIDGIDGFRVAYDVAAGGGDSSYASSRPNRPYLTCRHVSVGKELVTLHLPQEP